MNILILGGYGVFGGRLARLLSDIPQLQMIISGRDADRAGAFCAAFQGQAQVSPLQLDRRDVASALAQVTPDLVVDASGPFQAYGDDPYAVIRACIAAGVDYLDFADAADFVFGVSQFDKVAKQAGVVALSGVSSFPVLTAAVLRDMSGSMHITSVTGGIAPSPYAGIGLNVMRAVLGYAGEPVTLHRNGIATQARGLTESIRYTIAVPGRMPLRNLRFSLVDVPDLQVIPPEHEGLQDIWMGAGPVPESLHRLLNLLARARAALPLPSLVPLAGLFHWVLNRAKWGENRGGMFVQVRGSRDGQQVVQSWHLLAEGDDGPLIPSMAIEAIIRKILAGELPEPGARPATRALELADYQPLFDGRAIHTGMREELPPDAPLFRHILGPAFDSLPKQVRSLRDSRMTRIWRGQAKVMRGRGFIARAIAALFGFPPAGEAIPVSVTLSPEGSGERWVRDFGGRIFSSVLRRGTGRDEALLIEKFGPVSVALALVVRGERLFLIPRRWRCFGLPMPRFLLPAGNSFEAERDGKFTFDVEIAAPLIGLIVSYSGVLTPQDDKPGV